MARKELIMAIAYFRTSSATNVGEDKDTLKRQRAAVEAFAKAAGYELIAEYRDDAVKGSDPVDQRPGFAAMLKHIAGNGVHTIIVETANRFAHDLITQETGWRFLRDAGIALIAADSPDAFLDDTPTAVMIRQILGDARGQAPRRSPAKEGRLREVRGPKELRRTQSRGSRSGQATAPLSGQQPQALAAGHRRRTGDGWPHHQCRQAVCGGRHRGPKWPSAGSVAADGPQLARTTPFLIRRDRALVEARRNCSDLSQAVEGSLGWDRLATNLEAAAEALGADEGDGLEELIGRHASLRRAAAVLFDAFVFRSFKPHDPILTAIDILRAIYRRERRKLPDRVPTVFLKRSWRKRVRAGTDGFDARAYEVAVFVHLRDRLRAGDIWVEGSRAYRTFDDYLLPRPTFTLMRAEGRLGLAVPDDFAAWRAERAALLDLKLNALSLAATKNQLPDAAITADGLTISPIRREEQEHARALSSRLYNLMPRVRITDLLAEVNVWTAFANRFTHFRTGEPAAADEPALMGAILADATNLGLDRMAESSRGVTIHQLNLVIERHIGPETRRASPRSSTLSAPNPCRRSGARAIPPPPTGNSSQQAAVARQRRTTTPATALSLARCSMTSSPTASPRSTQR